MPTIKNLVNNFCSLMEASVTYELAVPHSFEKQMRKLSPKDKTKVMTIMEELRPYIIKRIPAPPNTRESSIYDWHLYHDGTNRADFHSSAYTVMLQYDDMTLKVRPTSVASYANSPAHSANSK